MNEAGSTWKRGLLGLGLLGWPALLGTGVMLGCSSRNDTVAATRAYHERLAATGGEQPPTIPSELQDFVGFLTRLGEPGVAQREAEAVYAPDAVLNDTLVVKQGSAAIRDHFAKTAEAMQEYRVRIDDVSRSGPNYYLRWTMEYRSKALDGGAPIHSVGMTQVRLNSQGKVVLHHDFWDSSHAFFEQVPVLGGGIQLVRRRL